MKRVLGMMMALMFVAAGAFADGADVGPNLKVQTFQFKHKQADQAAAVIKPLISAEGSMSIQPASNSLVVTDIADNIRRIASMLAKFDVAPQPLNLAIRLVGASRGDADRVDPSLADVASKLALLRYNVLEAVAAAEVTGKEGEPGLIELNGYRAEFKFGEYDPASESIRLTDFKLSKREGDVLSPMLKTTLNLRLGQTVIIGATKQAQSQRALMIVIEASR
jgi:hypothetical protein